MNPEGQFVKIVDTRLDTHSNQSTVYVLGQGAKTVSYVPIIANSYSNQSVNFSLNNIATNVCRDSRMELEVSFRVEIPLTNSSNATVNTIQADNFGFAPYPLAMATSSISHKINQASYTLNTNQILDMLTNINAVPKNANFYNNTQPDCVDNFKNATGTNLTPLSPTTTSLNGNGVFKPRTLDYYVVSGATLASNSSGTLIIQGKLVEPLISPFNSISREDEPALWAITGEIINVYWVSNIFNAMFKYVVPTGCALNPVSPPVCYLDGTNFSGGTYQPPTLRCIYLTPHDEQIPRIPKQSITHYNDYVQFTNSIASNVAPNALITGVSSQVCQFTNCPQYIAIYARPSDSARDNNFPTGGNAIGCEVPNVYLSIESLSVQWDNGNPQLSSASANQLYNISEKNGLCMDRDQFLGNVLNQALVAQGAPPVSGVGSVLLVRPDVDLGASYSTTAGSGGRYVMQIQNMTLRNNTSHQFSGITLFVVGITSAILERVGGEYRNYLLTISDRQLYQARMANTITRKLWHSERFANAFFSGGGVGSFFKNLANKAVSLGKTGAKAGLNLLQQHPELLQQGVGMLQNVLGKGGIGARHHPKNMDLFYE